MLFNKYKNQIKKLQEDVTFWENSCNDLQNAINELREKNSNLKNINAKLNNQLIDMGAISKENEIMRKYYKLDEEPSTEVQAKVLADLRLHDMELKMLQEKLSDCQHKINIYESLLPLNSYLLYNCCGR